MMKKIGEIVGLQVQPLMIKFGDPEVYDPAGLVAVPRLMIGETGVMGVTAVGQQILDIHNPAHPDSRYRGNNGLSVGFTGHYQVMRDRFGSHMTTGCAAENMIIGTEQVWTLAELGCYLLIHQAATDHWVILQNPEVAAPCLPFTQFAAQSDLTPNETKSALQFLHQGMRGFYLTPVNASAETFVEVGDSVFTADSITSKISGSRHPLLSKS